eukprot:3264390-Amphidinium_carterae.2
MVRQQTPAHFPQLMGRVITDAVLPTGGDVFQVIELPNGFAGGVCAHLGTQAGGLMMEVQGMLLTDEPYHSGDEAGHLGVGAWQAALVPARGGPGRLPRGQATAKRGAGGGRGVTAKTTAVPLIGANWCWSSARQGVGLDFGRRGSTGYRSNQTQSEGRSKECRSQFRGTGDSQHASASGEPCRLLGVIQRPGCCVTCPVAPSLLATNRVPPPPGMVGVATPQSATMSSPCAYHSALESARSLLPVPCARAPAPGRVPVEAPCAGARGAEPDNRAREAAIS